MVQIKRIEKRCEGECPECGSANINWYDGEDFDSSKIYKAQCDDCDCYFTEEYDLKYCCTVVEKEDGNEKGMGKLITF